MFGGSKGLERLKLEYNEITQGKCLKQIEGFVEIFNSNYLLEWIEYFSRNKVDNIRYHKY